MQENLEIYTMFQYSREKKILKFHFRNLKKYLPYFWRENSNTFMYFEKN